MEKDAPKLVLEITEYDLKSRGRPGFFNGGPPSFDHHQTAGVGNSHHQDMVYNGNNGGNGGAGIGAGSSMIYDPHQGIMVPRSGFAPGVPLHPSMNTR